MGRTLAASRPGLMTPSDPIPRVAGVLIFLVQCLSFRSGFGVVDSRVARVSPRVSGVPVLIGGRCGQIRASRAGWGWERGPRRAGRVPGVDAAQALRRGGPAGPERGSAGVAGWRSWLGRRGRRVLPSAGRLGGGCGELVQPAGDADREQRSHIHAVLTCGYPEGRCRRAPPSLASRKMFST